MACLESGRLVPGAWARHPIEQSLTDESTRCTAAALAARATIAVVVVISVTPAILALTLDFPLVTLIAPRILIL